MKLTLVTTLLLTLIVGSIAVPQCDDSWQQCVGSTKPCVKGGCWGWPSNVQNTVHKEVVQYFNDEVILPGNFEAIAFALDPNVCVSVPSFSIQFCGLQKFIGYLYLPVTSDLYAITNTTVGTMVQEGLTIFTNVYQEFTILTTGQKLNLISVWEVHFNDAHQIIDWIITPDALAIFTNLNPDLTLNITNICTKIQDRCTGDHVQFVSFDDCLSFYDNRRLSDGPSVLGTGNTVQCGEFHTILTATQPEVHCMHVGPFVIDPLMTPCTDSNQYA